MNDVAQVIAQMVACDMPQLPPNHPVLDGKFHRFGPKKKGWYILRELVLKTGRRVVTGAFGFHQGDNRNTVPVTVDAEAMTDDERAEFATKLRENEQRETEKKQREAQLASNRARDQWMKAAGIAVQHPYLDRKQIAGEGVRVDLTQLSSPLARVTPHVRVRVRPQRWPAPTCLWPWLLTPVLWRPWLPLCARRSRMRICCFLLTMMTS